MNRKTKNIILCIIIALLIASVGFTVYLADRNLSAADIQALQPGNDANGDMQDPPEKPDGDNGDNGDNAADGAADGENAANGDMQEPPEKSDGDNAADGETGGENDANGDMQEPQDMPDGDNAADGETDGENDANGDMQEPPEKPDGDNAANGETDGENDANGETDGENDANGDMQEPPEKPDGDNAANGKTDGENADNGEAQAPPNMSNSSAAALTVPYYIAFGLEFLLLSLAVIYLIQSAGNKKSFKETYAVRNEIIIGIVIAVIATTGLTCGTGYITNHYVLAAPAQTEQSMPGEMNQSSDISYTAATAITESTTLSDEEYSSTTADENALSASGEIEVTADGITVTKTGDSDGGDNTSFYGTNSAIIAKDGATLNISNANISTDATGANGVFSYGGTASTQNATGDGTTVNISDSVITTKKDNSGGIMTTGGGITNAKNLTVTTAGTSSAAIRSDRGGGEVNVDGGTYSTTGLGSPSIYSTANIIVKNAELTATMSEGAIIEGKNSITLENVTLTDTNTDLNGQSTTYKNIFLYQSMSGDADEGTSTFTASDSTITTNQGDTFYITNTNALITLTGNEIINNDKDGNFLRAQADSWGNEGSNGGNVTLIFNSQTAAGNIVIDSISTLDFTLNSASAFSGTINGDNSAESIALTLDKTSKITLTGDSYVTSLDNADSTNSNIDFNGYKLYVNGKAIN